MPSSMAKKKEICVRWAGEWKEGKENYLRDLNIIGIILVSAIPTSKQLRVRAVLFMVMGCNILLHEWNNQYELPARIAPFFLQCSVKEMGSREDNSIESETWD